MVRDVDLDDDDLRNVGRLPLPIPSARLGAPVMTSFANNDKEPWLLEARERFTEIEEFMP